MSFLVCFVYLVFATIMPRFIISVRELYDRDLDFGFGVLSQPTASRGEALSAIAFADVASGQDHVEGDAGDFGGDST